jgi:hypothetical protein
MAGVNGNERVRAWVLIQADPEVAAEIHGSLGAAGGDDYVVVRADVVDYHFNIVVPVDAANEEQLCVAVCEIRKIKGVGATLVIPVTEHNPDPPHKAHGYISEEEANAYWPPDEPDFEPGRQGSSPGGNAWG